MIKEFAWPAKRAYIIIWASFLLFIILFASPKVSGLSTNLCNICLSNFVIKQTGSCQVNDIIKPDELFTVCNECWLNPVITSKVTDIQVDSPEFSGGELRQAQGKPPHQDYVAMWWNSEISATVHLPNNFYQLQLHAKHDEPGPIILQVFANQTPLGILKFEDNDNSWSTKCLLLHPLQRQQINQQQTELTIRIRFTNDGGDNGSRNAAIAWLRFVTLPLND